MSWIKLEHSTPDKPEIVRMAADLGIDQDLVFAKCIRVWIWADLNSLDGNAVSVTETFLDRYTHCDGFAKAMRGAGWLTGENGSLTFPHFERHNGKTAKMRANTQIRVQSYRHCVTLLKQNCNTSSVTKALPDKSKIMDIYVPRAKEGTGMSLEQCLKLAELRGIAADCAESWWLSVDARGWLDTNGQLIVNPESSLRKWAVTWRANECKAKLKESQPPATTRKPSILDLKIIMAAKTKEATELKNVHSAEVAMGRTWDSTSAKVKWQKLFEEIKNLNHQIATYPNRQ